MLNVCWKAWTNLDWPEGVKDMQRNWIGKSTGAEVDFEIEGLDKKLRVYTTRPDTLFGATYMVVAPEHALLNELTTPEKKTEVKKYIQAASLKSDLDRTDLAKEKTGVFTGRYAINPVNGQQDSDMGGRLCIDGIWNRGDYGGSCARYPRL